MYIVKSKRKKQHLQPKAEEPKAEEIETFHLMKLQCLREKAEFRLKKAEFIQEKQQNREKEGGMGLAILFTLRLIISYYILFSSLLCYSLPLLH